jgi:hypothetical protein
MRQADAQVVETCLVYDGHEGSSGGGTQERCTHVASKLMREGLERMLVCSREGVLYPALDGGHFRSLGCVVV